MGVKRFWSNLRTELRRVISPVFIGFILLSTMLWFLTKLSYSYQTHIPFTVQIDDNRFKIECMVEGSGYRLVSYRYFKKNRVNLNFRDVQTTPSVISNGSFVINPYSLQNAISLRTSDLRIISVGDLPEITPDGYY